MMLKGSKQQQAEGEVEERALEKAQDWRSMVVVPITVPMSVGGTTAAYVVSATAFAKNTIDLLAISGVVLLFCIVIWLTHLFSLPIGKVVRPGGRDSCGRDLGDGWLRAGHAISWPCAQPQGIVQCARPVWNCCSITTGRERESTKGPASCEGRASTQYLPSSE